MDDPNMPNDAPSVRPEAAKGFVLTGLHVLIIMVLFFGLIIGINVTFVVAALKTFSGADEHAWIEGLHFNETLAAQAEQNELGWVMGLDMARTNQGNTIFTVTLKDKSQTALSDVNVTLDIERRVGATAHHHIICQPEAAKPGQYGCTAPNLPPGRWGLQIGAEKTMADGHPAQFSADTNVVLR